jgi:internalin A
MARVYHPSMRRRTWLTRLAAVRITLSGLLVCAALGCDDPKAKAAPAPSASAPSSSASHVEEPTPAPPTKPTAAVRKRKDPASCPKSGTVVFDDPALEAVVRRQLQKPSGPVARAELKKVKTLDLSQQTASDELDPCIFPYLTGLKGLYLPPGDLDDLSAIKGATSLESLRVSATKVSDLAPLSGLHKLDRLDLGRTPVRDLAPLGTLENLTELQIDDTEVSDLSPLAKLTKLEVLLIKRTRVSDVSVLKGMRKLKHLYIEGSLVRDLSPVSSIPGLRIHEGS